MPTNKKESLVFTMFMCAFMVFWMSAFNISLQVGISDEALKEAWLGFPVSYLIAILCDWFIVAKIAKKFAFKIVKNDSKVIIKIIIVSFCMVVGMVICMSLYGAIEQFGIGDYTLIVWLENIPKNFLIALPLQLFIAGPFIRSIFNILFTRQIA